MRSNRHQSQSSRRNKSSRTGSIPAIQSLEARRLMSAVPALSSRPAAYEKLYIDFDGDTTANWGSYHPNTTPAYDTDGNPSSFSTGELANIQQIWARVAEKYSPFNIDVTTVDPGNLTDGRTMRIVVGGNGSWIGGGTGGITWINGFKNSSPNTGYVFSNNLAGGDPHYVGEAVSHEAGHGFGLNHQSSYSGSTQTAMYNAGNSATAPVMGNSYAAARGLWYYGQSDQGSGSYQDDLAILSNSIGYRADDVGNSIYAASPLSLSGSSVSASGVIDKTSDSDFFSFSTSGGTASFSASPATYGGMLDLQLSLYNSSGNLIANANTASLGESLSSYLSAGTYYVAVGSHGSYGDVGQYSIAGTIAAGGNTTTVTTPAPSVPNAPYSAGASAASSSQISLSWADNSSNETAFKIERMANNSGTWTQIATVNANVTAYADAGLSAGTNYAYRVRATSSAGDSGYSNTAYATTSTGTTMTTPVITAPLTTATKVTGTPIGTAGSYGNSGMTFDKALDGNLSTYFDSTQSSGAYVGYDLGSAKVISLVRFAPRTGLGSRMDGGTFQGSNDNSSWTTLYTITATPGDGQYSTGTVTNISAFRYVRYVSPAGGFGNVADVEFYSSGSGTTTTTTTTSSAGTKVTGTSIGTAGSYGNSGMTFDKALDGNLSTYFDSTQSSGAYVGYDLGSSKVISSVRYAPRTGLGTRMVGGTFQGSNDNSAWTTLYTVTSTPADGQYTTGTVTNTSAFRYVRYVSPAGGFGNVADVEFYSSGGSSTTNNSSSSTATQLRGTAIGTAGSFANSGNTFANAFDGSLDTYVDAPTSQAWVGIDFGSSQYVSSARYAPRAGLGARMVGGIFQGSNDAANWTTLGTITSTPADGQYTTLNFTSPGTYRYVRYLSPTGGFGNVAELQFYSGPAAAQAVTVMTQPYNPATPEADATPAFCNNLITDLL